MALFQPTGQVRLTNIAVVRLKKFGKVFEVPTYKNKILSWRDGNEEDFDEVVQIARVFKNVSKGEYANKVDMMEVFGTINEEEVCKLVMKLGDVQISEKEREAHFGSLWTEVVELVSERVYDLRSGVRLSAAVLEKTLKDVAFSVKASIPAKRQSLLAVNALIAKRGNIIGRFKMQLKVAVKSEAAQKVETLLEEVGASQISRGSENDGKWVVFTFLIPSAAFRDVEVGCQKIPSAKVDILSSSAVCPDEMRQAKIAADEEERLRKLRASYNPLVIDAEDVNEGARILYIDSAEEKTLQKGVGAMGVVPGTGPVMATAGVRSVVTAAPKHRPAVVPGALRKAPAPAAPAPAGEAAAAPAAQPEEATAVPAVSAAVPSTTPAQPTPVAAEEPAPAPVAAAPAPVTPAARGMLCSTCKVTIMGGAVAFRAHSKEDWHAHNVKRKVRNLEPLSEEVFQATPAKELNAFLAVTSD